jgi:predicted amidohydrolase
VVPDDDMGGGAVSEPLRVACIQHCATLDIGRNLAALREGIAGSVAAGAVLVALPEYCATYGEGPAGLMVGAEPEATHPGLAALRAMTREHGCWLAVGSLGVRTADGRTWNRSYLLDPEGEIRARYDKIHLFDVDLAGGESYRESATIAPGERAVVAETPFGGLGLSICYDLRFPQLYRTLAQAGARILLVPAAFTRTTGRAHWHVLLRARAIETGCFVVAASQCGEAADGRLARYGHSLIVAPWGEVLADAGEEQGIVTANLDLQLVDRARRAVPALRHDRAFRLASDLPG